jgi:hypothetical protein
VIKAGKNLILAGALSLAITTAGCAYPTSETIQGGQESAMYFDGFPESAQVYVNGTAIGSVSEFNGVDATLAVPSGTHSVTIIAGATELFNEKVYVGRDSALKVSP